MALDIPSLITACEWFPSKYLVISDNVFSPLLYYSYFGAIIPTILIALFVFFKKKKSLEGRLLLLTSIFFVVWVLGALVLWATEFPRLTMFFWTLINLVEPFIYFFAFYFAFVFIREKDFNLKQKILFSLPLLVTVILAPTKFMLLGYDLSNCDRNAYEGIAASYGYLIEIFYVVLIFITSVRSYRATLDREKRRKILLFAVGIIAFLLSFSLGNIIEVFSENWYIGQYGLLGAPIFVGFLAYIIVKFKAFNLKLINAQVLVAALLVALFSIFFVRSNDNIHAIIAITLVLVAWLGFILIRSVKREIEQREKLQALTSELKQANEKLKSLDKLKTEFLSLASHQLRSPLTAIKGYASMLDEGAFGPITDKQDEAVKRIYTSAQGLVSLVEDLLNVSKIEQGGMKYEFMPTDLSKIVNDLAGEMKISAETKHLEFRVVVPKYDAFTVSADPVKIHQVMLNLIDNSIKYTATGFVEIGLTREANNVIFYVKDSGIGVTAETKAKLFQKFSRGEGARMNTGGSGLGLYLAQEITKAHKGDIKIDSEGLGKGTTFSVILPNGFKDKEFNRPS